MLNHQSLSFFDKAIADSTNRIEMFCRQTKLFPQTRSSARHHLEQLRFRAVFREYYDGFTGSGILHGGVLMGLADAVGGYCAYLNLPPTAGGTATIESKTNFLRPVRSGSVRATARPLQVGRTVIVIDTEMHDDQHRLVARTTQTQAVLQG